MDKKKLLALGVIGATVITSNVNAQELIYGEDIPEGKEHEYAFVENETQEDAYTDLTNEEANELKISLEASGYTTVTIKSYSVKTGEITNSIEEEFSSYEEAMAYIDELEASGKTVTNVEFVNNTGISDEETLNQTFDTWEEANEALQAFLDAHDIDASGEITDVLTDEVIDEITDTTLYDTEDDANAALEAFISDPDNNTNSFYFTGTVSSTSETETTEINEHFNSLEEAENFLANLDNEGYTIVSYNFTNDTDVKSDDYEETFDNEEDANAALQNFINEHDIEASGEVTHNETDTVIDEITDDKLYDTEADANAALAAFLNDPANNTNSFYFTGTVTSTSETETTEINEHFNSLEEAENFLANLENEGYTIVSYSFTNDTDVKSDDYEEIFDNEEDANAALQNFINEHDIEASGEVTHNETDTVIEEITDTTIYETQAEAEAALNAFLNDPANNTNSFYFTGTVISSSETKTTEINEHFNSRAEALVYIESLYEAGYKDISFTFTNDTETVEDPYEETFETEAEAQTALSEYESNHNDVTSSITPIHDSSEDSVETINSTFTNDTEANNFYNEQLGKQSNDVDVNVTITSNQVAQETIELEEVYTTEEEANARLNELSSEYDVVESSSVVTYEAGAVYEAIRITNYQDEYEIGNTLFLVNKHGGQLFVWTQNALTADEIAEFKRTYPSFHADPAISNVDNATFIYGLDSEYVTGNNKIFTIEERDGVLYAVMEPGSTAHVVYGHYVPQLEYHVIAKVHNNDKHWTVAGTVTTKGYDYKLTANGTKTVTLNSGTVTGTKKKDVYSYNYVVQKKAKNHTVTATGKKTVILESGALTGTKERELTHYYYTAQKKAKNHTVKATGKKTVTLESGTLTGTKERELTHYNYIAQKKVKKHKVTASGKKTIELESGKLTATTTEDEMTEFYALDLVRQKFEFVGGIGEDEPENPNTGDESLWVFTIGGFSMIGLAATAPAFKKKED